MAPICTLTQDDAFEVAPNRKMDVAVPSLTDSYDHVRTKTQRQVEEKRQKMLENSQINNNNKSPDLDSVKKSQTLVLLKALIRYQRPMLIFTGFMKVIKYRYPSLPRSIGSTVITIIGGGNVTTSIEKYQCCLLLVSVSFLKMIVENQLFHNVVSMAT